MGSISTQLPALVAFIQLFLSLGSTSLYSLESPPSSLKSVNVLYRHGDRSPAFIYPKDIHQVPAAWSDGLGWLSDIGKQQQFELGQWIGQRYKGFLNIDRYTHSEITIKASGVPRALMSAYSNLAGLFPPKGDQLWHKDFPWQPIPVQTVPVATDNVLAQTAACPRYDQLMLQELSSPKIRKEEQDNKVFYDMIVRETGIEKENIRDIWGVVDALICEKAHGFPWNAWANKPGVWEKLSTLRTWSFDLLYGLPEMAKLKGGPLLKEIVGNLQLASSAAAPIPKFYMYSAHDTTVASLLSAMQVWDQHQPMYRALIMVELHDIPNIGEVVKVFYRNDTTKDPYELLPPGCESPCKLDTFIRVANERIPTDWHLECDEESAASTGVSPASWIALLTAVCVATLLVVALSIMFFRLRGKRNHMYSKI